MAVRFVRSATCCSLRQLKYVFYAPPILTPFSLQSSFLHKASSSDVLSYKIFNRGPATEPPYDVQRFFVRGHLWIHSGYFLNVAEKAVEPQSIASKGDGSSDLKKKRKKLKGKRAVVRWLKFFRWKKKKDYARMTPEEKILYKLRKARRKEERFTKALQKIEPKESSETTHDPEILTPEEHFYFLKMGQKCKNYVPVGTRGIYQGVILNMHLHWKKHQTLQVVVKTFTSEEVKEIAVELARLSGGIVLDIQEGNTIIMYRGKNYTQPPTEIMSPRTTLPRKKALEKSKYIERLRAVRRYIPKLERKLELLHVKAENKGEVAEETPLSNTNNMKSSSSSNLQLDHSNNLKEALAMDGECDQDDDSTMESSLDSDSEQALSDIFETDDDEKAERPLFLDQFEKFPAKTDGEKLEFEEYLRQISAESKKAKALGKDVEVPNFDEVDRMFLHAASLLKKTRR